jgi:Ca2+-binding RTX toxin-like protein
VIDATGAPLGPVYLWFAGAPAGVDVNLTKGTARGLGHDTLRGTFIVYGTRFADHMVGDEEANQFFGEGGDDTLSGRDGDDRLNGSDGNDVINGDNGADGIYGAGGNDTYSGGGGNDLIAECDSCTGRDRIIGGAGDDTIRGGPDTDYGDGGTNGAVGDACVGLETMINCER